MTIRDILVHADASRHLPVMGGYGHSRMRELVLGGATRGILRNITVPVFLVARSLSGR